MDKKIINYITKQQKERLDFLTTYLKQDIIKDFENKNLNLKLNKLNKNLKEILGRGRPYIRISIEGLLGVLGDGQYKTLFETGVSGGGTNLNARADIESKLFGHDLDVLPAQRPKYGYLYDENPLETVFCNQYGNCAIELKKTILEKSTFCFGDSSAIVKRESGKMVVTFSEICFLTLLIDKYHLNVVKNEADVMHLLDMFIKTIEAGTIKDIYHKLIFDYIEIQYHSKISLKDIKAIHVPEDVVVTEDIKKICKENNIPYCIQKAGSIDDL